jgi:hypothetical protein
MALALYGLWIETEIPLDLPLIPRKHPPADIFIQPLERESSRLSRVMVEAWDNALDSGDKSPPKLQTIQKPDGNWTLVRYEEDISFLINQAGTEVWVRQPPTTKPEDTATYVFGPILGIVLRLRGIIALHASAVAIGGHCVIVVGSAGAGKSTTAGALAMLGHSVLTEDIAALDDQGDRFRVQPGYPRVNLWPASVELLFGSVEALERICPQHPTWDKRYLDLSVAPYRFQDEPLSLGAIYVLDGRSKDERAPAVEPLSGREALLTLVANTYANHLLDKQMRAHEFEVLGRLVQHVPVRRVTPHADPAQIWELGQCIVDDFRTR